MACRALIQTQMGHAKMIGLGHLKYLDIFGVMAPSRTSSCTNFHGFGAFFTSKVTAFWGWMLDVTAQTHTCARREDGNRGMEHATSNESKRLRIHGTMCLGHARGWCASARTYAIKSIIHIHTYHPWPFVRSMLHSISLSFQSRYIPSSCIFKYQILNIYLPHQCDTSSHPAPRAPTGTCQEAEGQEPHLTFTAQSIVRCRYLWPRIQDTKYTV